MFDKLLFIYFASKNKQTINSVASYLGINQATLHRKMKGDSDFTRNEIQQIKTLLNLNANDIDRIFFA